MFILSKSWAKKPMFKSYFWLVPLGPKGPLRTHNLKTGMLGCGGGDVSSVLGPYIPKYFKCEP